MSTRHLVCAALALCTACGPPAVSYRWMEPGTERVWQPSFVVLFGQDQNAPQIAPKHCKRLAGIDFVGRGEKAYHFGGLRKAAQEIGGNGVTEIVLVSRRDHHYQYTALIVACSERLFARAPRPMSSLPDGAGGV